MVHRLSILLVIMCVISSVQAQNVGTTELQWNSVETLYAATGNVARETTAFVTQSGSLEWKNADNSVRQSFQILKTLGSWMNIAQPGQIQFEVKSGSVYGTVTIRKTYNETKVTIVQAVEESIIMELSIQSVQTL